MNQKLTNDDLARDIAIEDDGAALPHTGRLELADLALDPQYTADDAVTERVQTVIPICKANPKKYIQIHPAWYQEVAAVDLGDRSGIYVVHRKLQEELVDEIIPVGLFVGLTKQGSLFVLPVKLAGRNGKMHDASRSALLAIEIAKTAWVRIQWNDETKSYDVRKRRQPLSPPVWPAMTFEQIITVALSDRVIDALDHPAVRELRGED